MKPNHDWKLFVGHRACIIKIKKKNRTVYYDVFIFYNQTQMTNILQISCGQQTVVAYTVHYAVVVHNNIRKANFFHREDNIAYIMCLVFYRQVSKLSTLSLFLCLLFSLYHKKKNNNTCIIIKTIPDVYLGLDFHITFFFFLLFVVSETSYIKNLCVQQLFSFSA